MSSCVSVSPAARTAGRVTRYGGNEGGEPHQTEEYARSPLTQPRQQSAPIQTFVAMPPYNEEAYIPKMIVGAQQHADNVLVIDDGSNDDTIRIARALGAIVATDFSSEFCVLSRRSIKPTIISRVLEGYGHVINAREIHPKFVYIANEADSEG